jgi:hypothetical protein
MHVRLIAAAFHHLTCFGKAGLLCFYFYHCADLSRF